MHIIFFIFCFKYENKFLVDCLEITEKLTVHCLYFIVPCSFPNQHIFDTISFFGFGFFSRYISIIFAMPRIKPTTTVDVLGNLDLRPEEAVGDFIESKQQDKFFM